VTGNNFTSGGEKLPLIVQITNRNNSPLNGAELVMQYPQDSSTSSSSGSEDFRESLGTIPAGTVVNENLTPVLYGEQGSTHTITISLEYQVTGSNAIFVKDQPYTITIDSTPVNLSVDAPATISPNQSITLDVKATLNSTTPLATTLVKVDYPIGFQFVSAVPAPSFGNNVWNLGNLAPGAEHDISITGTMIGVFSGDQKTFNISTGSQSGTDKSAIDVVFNSMQQTVAIQKPFVEADIAVNGVSGSQFTTTAKTPVDVQIHYINNLNTTVDNLQIQAKISGNAFDPRTVNVSQGFYDSTANTITWDKSYESQLAQVNPGDSGTLSFSVTPTSLFSATGGLLASPSINIEVDVSGQQADSGFAVNSVTNSSNATIKIISDVGFSDKALYYSGPFSNTGPIPPTVGKATTYTVVWSLSDTANSISNAQVTSSIPQWVNFVGTFLPASEDLTYNPTTRQILWNADRIPAGAGITGTSRSVSFQVSLNPSLSQIGTSPVLINAAVLTGHDDFANVDLTVNKAVLTSSLSGDTTFPANGGSVVSN
jgi:hypothetical protein